MAQNLSRDSPLLFIQYDKNGTFSVTPEAKALLQSIRNKIAVIVLVGSYRTGKSYLMNRLQHNQNLNGDSIPTGFAVGNTINACTKGIWISSKPYYDETSDTTYLFLDTEGLNSTNENQTHDPEIFTLGLLFSSVFVLNTTLNITEASLEQLELVIQASKTVAFNHESAVKKQALLDDEDADQFEYNNDMDAQLALNYPRLLWVVRDFTLQLVDKNNNPLTANQYLEEVLRDVPARTKSAQLRNTVRKCIRDSFVQRDCITLVRPVTDERLLCKLDQLKPSELRPEFELGIYILKNYLLGLHNHYKPAYHDKIRSQLSEYAQELKEYGHPDVIKKIDGKAITGDVLVGLAEIYCKAMTNREIPVIYSSWQSVVNTKMAECTSELTTAFKAWLSQLLTDPDYATYYPLRDEEREPLTRDHLELLSLTKEHLLQQQHQVHQKMSVVDLDDVLESQLTAIRQKLFSWFPDDEDKVKEITTTICANSETRYKFVQRKLQETARRFNNAMWERVENSPDDDDNVLPYDALDALILHEEINEDCVTRITDIASGMLSRVRILLRGDDVLISEMFEDISRSLYEHIIETCIDARHDLMARAFKLQDHLLDAQEQLQEQTTLNEQLEAELETSKEQNHSNLQRIKELEAEAGRHTDELTRVQRDHDKLTTKMQQQELHYEKQLLAEQAKQQQIENTAKNASHDLTRARQDLKQFQTDYNALKEEFSEYKQKQKGYHQSHTEEQQELQQKLTLAQQKYQQQQQHIRDLESQLEELRVGLSSAQRYQSAASSAESNLRTLKSELHDAIAEVDTLKANNSELRSAIQSFKAKEDTLQHRIKELGDLLQTREDTIRNHELLRNKQQHEGQRLEQEVQQLHEELERSQSELQRLLQQPRGKLSTSIFHHDRDDQVDYDTHDAYDEDVGYVAPSKSKRSSRVTGYDEVLAGGPSPSKRSIARTTGGTAKKARKSFEEPQSSTRTSLYDHEHDFSDGDDDDFDVDDSYFHDDESIPEDAPSSQSQGGWELPFTTSPVKQPDQAKIIARRRARGSLLDEPVQSSSNKRLSMGMRKHPRVIDPAFKKAVIESWNDDYDTDENPFAKQGKSKGRTRTTSIASPAAAVSPSPSRAVPLDAEPVRDPQTLTIPQLKSWLTSLDVALPMGKRYKRDDYIRLLYDHDPRL